MRGSRWLALLLVVLCACDLDPNTAQVGDPGTVYVVLRGLLALQTTPDGLSVLFLSPSSDPHPPTLPVDLMQLTGPPDAPPNMTIPDSKGYAFAAWHIEEVTLEASNVEDTVIEEGAGEAKGAAIDTKIRWIPHMEDIYGSPQTLTEPAGMVAARGTFKAGHLEPLFDRSQNKDQLFTIGARECTALADGARLTLKMKDSLKPILTFKTATQSGKIQLKPGNTIVLAAFPQNQPQGDLVHFHHYYDLVPGAVVNTPTECTDATATTPTGFPVRCAPIKFP